LQTSIGFVTVTAVIAARAPAVKPSMVDNLTGTVAVPAAPPFDAILETKYRPKKEPVTISSCVRIKRGAAESDRQN
jgi:hypothetical protein